MAQIGRILFMHANTVVRSLIANEETIEAMKAARRGQVVTVGSVYNLLANLNNDEDD
jgi:hypothetical protein